MKSGQKILKEIWSKEKALKENLLPTKQAEKIQKNLISYLQKTLKKGSIPSLRFKKIITQNKYRTWWSSKDNYPVDSPWEKIQPFLDILAQHEAEKTIRNRIETEGLFIESRSQNEDQHLLIGTKEGKGKKAHIIIDGKTGEIRIESNQQEPTQLTRKIETFLTLPSGERIRTTRELIKKTSDYKNKSN